MRRIAYGMIVAAAALLIAASSAPAEEGAPAPRPQAGAANVSPEQMAEAISAHGAVKEPPRGLAPALVDAEGDSPFSILPLIYALVATAGVCVVGFKDSKRTHLD